MAGIGFELRKIYRKEGITRNALGAIYSSMVTIGPMVLVMCMLLLLYYILGMSHVSYADRELLSSAILYNFIFSVLVTSPFNVTFSRYLADKFFTEDFSDIMDSFYGGILCISVIATLLALPVAWSLYYRGGVSPAFIAATYVQWMSLIFLFFSITYLHATKDYKIIAAFYFAGLGIGTLLASIFATFTNMGVILAIQSGTAIGFFIVAVMIFAYLKRYFSGDGHNFTQALKYMWTCRKFLLANLFYVGGLYVHNFVFWFHPTRSIAGATYYTNQAYDMATCIAMFTNIYLSVSFVVMVETRFHMAYKEYMESILGGTHRVMDKTKLKMFRIMRQQMEQMFGTQVAITTVIFLVVITFGAEIGFDATTLAIYPVLAVAFLGVFMMYCNIVYLYYFADMTGAMLTSLIYFAATLLGAMFSSTLAVRFWGLGFLIGVLSGWTFSFFRLRWIERNIETYMFCDYKIINTMKSSAKGKVVYTKPKED